jgi:hypothetical protein
MEPVQSRRDELAKPPKKEASAARMRDDGRRQFLMYAAPDLIKELKRAALDEDRPAYELAEEAVRDWLKRRNRSN